MFLNVSSSLTLSLSFVGHKLGLYRELARIGPATPAELAQATGTVETYIHFWLINQASEKYISYSPENGKYFLNDAQKKVFVDEEDQLYAVNYLFTNTGMVHSAIHKVEEEMKKGVGIPFGDHFPESFEGLEMFSKVAYVGNLVSDWVPSKLPPHLLSRVQNPETQPLVFLDVGCGRGMAVRKLAKTYPLHLCIGLDCDSAAIEYARQEAVKENVYKNTLFVKGNAEEFPAPAALEGFQSLWTGKCSGKYLLPVKYDIVTLLLALHDLADPVCVLRHIRTQMNEKGALLVADSPAADTEEGNFTPIGRMLSAVAVIHCSPSVLCGRADGRPRESEALHNLAPDAKYFEVFKSPGFKHVSCEKIETPATLRLFICCPD